MDPGSTGAAARYSFWGLVIGRQHIGKKCVFLDLVELQGERNMKTFLGGEQLEDLSGGNAKQTAGDLSELPQQVVHLVGDHVARERPLTVDDDLLGKLEGQLSFHTVFAARSPEALDNSEFAAFTASIGSPGEISRMRMGDVVMVEAEPHSIGEPKKARGGVLMRRGNAKKLVLVRRGAIARPGDYGTKWNVPPKDQLVLKQGTPRRHGHRFRLFAEFCRDTFFTASGAPAAAIVRNKTTSGDDLFAAQNSAASTASHIGFKRSRSQQDSSEEEGRKNLMNTRSDPTCSTRPLIIDVAGGSGKLRDALRSMGYDAVVVDPRPEFLTKRGKNRTTVMESDQVNHEQSVRANENTISRNSPLPSGAKSCRWGECVRDFFDTNKQEELIKACALIVGLHCDGAVNEIIHAAAKYQRSFAICACCVFPKQYPRQLRTGKPVILREELNAWIAEEAVRHGFKGQVHTTALAFDGANDVVFGIADE